MTEQLVKDAQAKRDAAQAELDKAVQDTKDEIQKASDAVKAAVPDKAPEKPSEPPVVHPPEPPNLHIVAPTSYLAPATVSKVPVIVGIVLLVAALGAAHFYFHWF